MDPDESIGSAKYHRTVYEVTDHTVVLRFHECVHSLNAQGRRCLILRDRKRDVQWIGDFDLRSFRYNRQKPTHQWDATGELFEWPRKGIRPTVGDAAGPSQQSSLPKPAQPVTEDASSEWVSAISSNRLKNAFASMQSEELQPVTKPQSASIEANMGPIRSSYSRRQKSKMMVVRNKRAMPEEDASATPATENQAIEPSEVHEGNESSDTKPAEQQSEAVKSEPTVEALSAAPVGQEDTMSGLQSLQHKLGESSGISEQHSAKTATSGANTPSNIDGSTKETHSYMFKMPGLKEEQSTDSTRSDKTFKKATVAEDSTTEAANKNILPKCLSPLSKMAPPPPSGLTPNLTEKDWADIAGHVNDFSKNAMEAPTTTRLNTKLGITAPKFKAPARHVSGVSTYAPPDLSGVNWNEIKGVLADCDSVSDKYKPPFYKEPAGSAKRDSELAKTIEETGAKKMVDIPPRHHYRSLAPRGKFGRVTQIESHKLPVKRPEGVSPLYVETMALIDSVSKNIGVEKAEEKEDAGELEKQVDELLEDIKKCRLNLSKCEADLL